MTDFDLKEMIVDALDFEPSVNAAHVGVIVKDGIVTLTGHVPTFGEKTAAEQVVAREVALQFGWLPQPAHHLHDCRFAGAVSGQNSEGIAKFHAERRPVQNDLALCAGPEGLADIDEL